MNPPPKKAQFLEQPHRIRSKVTLGGPGAVDLAALDRAEKAIEAMAGDYLDWVASDLGTLEAAFATLVASDGADRDALKAVYRVAHEIKGQGGSFGFPLMTQIGNQLCNYVDTLGDAADARARVVIRLHIEALNLVIAQKLRGTGGPEGEALFTGLCKVVEKSV